MGLGVEYKCNNCGYTDSFGIGCGMRNGHENWMPALDKRLKEMVAIDTKKPIADPDNIVLYTGFTLNKKPFFRFTPGVIEWDGHILFTKYNFCPKCEKYRMSCEVTLYFD